MASPTQWTWIWGTGKPGVLQSMELQRVRHNWVTEQQSNLSHLFLYTLTFAFFATTKWAPTWHYIWNYSAGPAESLLALLHIFTQTAHSQCSFRGHICILTLQIPLCKYSLSPLLVYFIPNNTLYIALIPCYRLYIGQVFFFFLLPPYLY